MVELDALERVLGIVFLLLHDVLLEKYASVVVLVMVHMRELLLQLLRYVGLDDFGPR